MAKVDLENIKPNSNKYLESSTAEREKVKPVVKKENVIKKKSEKKIFNLFFKEDIKYVAKTMIDDYVVPGLQDLFLNGLSLWFTGESLDLGSTRRRKKRRRRDDDDEPYYRYGDEYDSDDSMRRRRRKQRDKDRRTESKKDYRNIVVKYREDAENIVLSLKNRIRDYGTASIADLYDLIEETSDYTDSNWGWDDEREIGIAKDRDGWLIDVDEAKYIGR